MQLLDAVFVRARGLYSIASTIDHSTAEARPRCPGGERTNPRYRPRASNASLASGSMPNGNHSSTTASTNPFGSSQNSRMTL